MVTKEKSYCSTNCGAMEFEKRKAQALAAMASPGPDKSPKGNLDAPIIPLLNAVNLHPCYFTTSSCSGRISVLRSLPPSSKKKAGGASWLFISHDLADPEILVERLFDDPNPVEGGDLVFRFEPLIIAIECRDVPSAQALVSTAIACGFRESGITSAAKRVMVAIRCSIRLEVPLGQSGRIMVSPEYVRYLVRIANEKMEVNRRRTDGFLNALECKGLPGSGKAKTDDDRKNRDLVVVVKEGLLNLEVRQKDLLSRIALLENGALKPHEQQTIVNCDKGSSRVPRCSLSVVMLMICGEPSEKLHLWGHSASTLSDAKQTQIFVFGGFGGIGQHTRRNYALMLEPRSGTLREINTVGSPSSRLGHTSSVVGSHIFIIGGRGGPTQIFDEVWVLDTVENRWKLLQCTGSMFHPRHRHAAVAVGSNIYVFGGLSGEVIYSCMNVLNIETLQWNSVTVQGEWPCGRHSHAMVSCGSRLFMFGGYDGEKALGDLYSFNVKTSCWKKERSVGRSPFPRFSHSMFLYKDSIGIIGGCPVRQHGQELALFDLHRHFWIHIAIDSIERGLWVRCSTSVIDDDLVIVGGGASCYAFGTKFDPPKKINLFPLKFVIGIPFDEENKQETLCDRAPKEETLFCSKTSVTMFQESNLNYRADQSVNGDGDLLDSKPFILKLEKRHAKLAKDILKKFGWLDTGRKVQQSADECCIYIPVNENLTAFIPKEPSGSLDASDLDKFQYLGFSREKGISANEVSMPKALSFLWSCGATLLSDDIVCNRKVSKAPKHLMRDLVRSLLKEKNMPLELLEQLPTRWERLGDIVVLPVTCFKDDIWDSIGQDLWPLVAKSLGCQRLARQGRIMPTGTRDSSLEILVGDDGWVTHHENGILYSFDATKCMFSSGNLSEKLRMAQLDCRDEIIVDLFAGIGYFTLPFLLKARAKLVYACEWNPHALNALQHNVNANAVADRCIILKADNRVTAPKGVADRVCLGLLPTSEASWPTAVRSLKCLLYIKGAVIHKMGTCMNSVCAGPGAILGHGSVCRRKLSIEGTDGGVLHIHGNANDSGEDSWLTYVVESITRIAESEGLRWHVTVQHLERVKWYAPHVRHLVADVKCKLLRT